jgi:ssDNA-binding Zn-finger/Zn-ribbon topoisomerase 1
MDDDEAKERELDHECPNCGAKLLVRIYDKMDHVRKIGCVACDVWGRSALTNDGGMSGFRQAAKNKWEVESE